MNKILIFSFVALLLLIVAFNSSLGNVVDRKKDSRESCNRNGGIYHVDVCFNPEAFNIDWANDVNK
jgi:hypothetical protein